MTVLYVPRSLQPGAGPGSALRLRVFCCSFANQRARKPFADSAHLSLGRLSAADDSAGKPDPRRTERSLLEESMADVHCGVGVKVVKNAQRQVVVEGTAPGGPAEGILLVGDIICEITNKK